MDHVDLSQCLECLRLRVLEAMSLVENGKAPKEALKEILVNQGKFVAHHQNVKREQWIAVVLLGLPLDEGSYAVCVREIWLGELG